jgi:NAD(P)-dependent dehydrogenase (short-subunit alcohol dehydrogenase family)
MLTQAVLRPTTHAALGRRPTHHAVAASPFITCNPTGALKHGTVDKTALVTGAGATGGVGHATAMLLAREGAQIAIAGRDANRGEAVIKELTDSGASARLITGDLLDPDHIHTVAQTAGDIDILVNNAALFPIGPTDQDLASCDGAFAANVRAPYFLTSLLRQTML